MNNKGNFFILGFIVFGCIAFFIAVGMLAFSLGLDQDEMAQVVERYKAVSSEVGVDWEQMVIYDMIRYDGDFDKAKPEETAFDFLYISEKKYSKGSKDWSLDYEHKYENKKDMETFLGKCLGYSPKLTINNIYDYISSSERELNSDADSYEKYSVSLEVKRFEDVIKRFKKDKREYALKLLEEHEIASTYGNYEYDGTDGGNGDYTGGDYDVPVITGDFTRQDIITVGKSIMNHPYLMGGKSPQKGLPKRPLDCSGYVDWVFVQLAGKTVGKGGGTASQFANTKPISHDDLKIGDLGFYYIPSEVPKDKWNHVGIYIGTVDGKDMFIHCGGSGWKTKDRPKGRVLITYNNTSSKYNGNSPSRFKYFRRINIDYKDE